MKKTNFILLPLALCVLILLSYNKQYKLVNYTINSRLFGTTIVNNSTGKKIRKPALLSYDIADIKGDGSYQLGIVYGNIITKKGGLVEIYSLKNLNTIYSKDLSEIQPWKISFGDITGDGNSEIALGIVKKTPLHKVMMKRCFFYNLDFNKGRLIPKYRASRFSQPLIDYSLFDLNKDGISEVLAIEANEDKSYRISAYSWNGFGFFLQYKSENYKTIKSIDKIKSKLYLVNESIYLN